MTGFLFSATARAKSIANAACSGKVTPNPIRESNCVQADGLIRPSQGEWYETQFSSKSGCNLLIKAPASLIPASNKKVSNKTGAPSKEAVVPATYRISSHFSTDRAQIVTRQVLRNSTAKEWQIDCAN